MSTWALHVSKLLVQLCAKSPAFSVIALKVPGITTPFSSFLLPSSDFYNPLIENIKIKDILGSSFRKKVICYDSLGSLEIKTMLLFLGWKLINEISAPFCLGKLNKHPDANVSIYGIYGIYGIVSTFCKGDLWKRLFTPAFSVMCIAAFYWYPSFDMLNEQHRSKSANHSPLAWPSDFVCSFAWNQQRYQCIGFDWLISNSTSKDNAERWCRKMDVER